MSANSTIDDTRLAELMDELLATARAGGQPDLRRLCTQYPSAAEEIQSLWATAMVAENLSQFEASEGALPLLKETHFPGAQATAIPRRLGDFEVMEEIGRGGMGVVYKARQLRLDRVVALKMILRGDLASTRDLARFRQEAEAAAGIEHPNIVPIYDMGEIDGRPYFSMQFIEGTTLSKRLAAGPLAPREAAEILLSVARAIAEAHRQGVLHRDLKPANILIDTQGQPHVTDFGLAKRTQGLSPLTDSGLLVGTPSYMAPEQALGERGETSRSPVAQGHGPRVGPAADVYSLGAILYEMLAGRPPFQAASAFDTVMMLLEHEPPPARMFNRKADPDLERIAMKCLQKQPALRYPTAKELADDLGRYLSNERLSVRAGSWTEFFSRMLRETHHAPLLENWGLLWMWNAVVLLAICLVTNGMQIEGVTSVGRYFTLWSLGLGTWAIIFWQLRRRAGPILFVERQVAHVWSASVLCAPLLYFLEILMGLPVLTLSPVLGLIAGTVFLVKASILTGTFYIQAAALFTTSFLMALAPRFGLTIFGVVIWASFFLPGLKYYRQRLRLQGD